MKTTRTTAGLICALAATVVALAGAPATRGKDKAVERVEAAEADHVRILTDLQTQLPPEAKADLATALAAAQKGLDAAHAALTRTPPPAPSAATAGAAGADSGAAAATTNTTTTSTTTTTTTTDAAATGQPATTGKPATVGLAKAREQVAASFATSTSTLQSVATRVPPQAAAKIQEAITRIEQDRARALANLDRVIAMERPEHPMRPDSAVRPEHADRPEQPSRPDRPEHPGPPGL